MSTWYVSRQSYWGVEPADQYAVEVAAGGLDHSGPDMLVPRYRRQGEGQEYNDPRAAVQAAIAVCKAWRADEPKLARRIFLSLGIGDKVSMRDALRWASDTYDTLDKCQQCGDVLPNERDRYTLLADPDLGTFCSEYCADRAAEEYQHADLLAWIDERDLAPDAEVWGKSIDYGAAWYVRDDLTEDQMRDYRYFVAGTVASITSGTRSYAA